MAETTDIFKGAADTRQDTGIAPAEVAPLAEEQATSDMPQAQSALAAAPEVQQTELPPDWVTKLQVQVTALQQAAQLQKKASAWFKQTMAKLPKATASQVNLRAELSQVEQQAKKSRETQTQAIIGAISRAVAAASKGLAAQLGKQLKDMDRRIKGVEKMLGQMQRKMK